MAERRMFAKSVIDSDTFLDMGDGAQKLYFHLCLRADDDGFVNNPKSLMRHIRSGDDDLKVLIAKQYVIPFESGVLVVRHWKIHNYIRNDRHRKTQHTEEKSRLFILENGEYSLVNQVSTTCLPDDNQSSTKCPHRLDKSSQGKDSQGERQEQPTLSQNSNIPTLDEIKAYCAERKNKIDPQSFFDYYATRGWLVSGYPMRDWRACVHMWEKRDRGADKEAEKETKHYGRVI